MYKISIVNYYNTTPFVYGLKHQPISSNPQFEYDIPSVCAQKLLNNQVDIGLVPVAILPALSNYSIISNYCIGAVGVVYSVKLFAQQPLENLTHILLDYQSKTSVTLVQVLNKHFWKKDITFVNAQVGFEKEISGTTGAVIIGVRTFGVNADDYKYQYDLSVEWQKYTNLPFVFACWVSTKKIDESFITEFNNSLKFGVDHIKQAVIEFPNNTKGFDAFDYLANKISYTFDDEKKKALELFLKLMKDI